MGEMTGQTDPSHKARRPFWRHTHTFVKSCEQFRDPTLRLPSPLCLTCIFPSLFLAGVALCSKGRVVHLLLHLVLVSGSAGLKQGDTRGDDTGAKAPRTVKPSSLS